MSRNLIICPIGDQSVHRTWLSGPERPDFDLFLCYFGQGPDTARAEATYYLRRTGFKWEHLHHLAEHHADVLARYDNLWCPDDDIACDTAAVNQLFALFTRHRLQLAQPALARGDFAFKALVQRPGLLLRYTPYVEIMCPLFTRSAFFKVRDTFLESRSGWGLDWLWPRRFAPDELAIIDKVGVHHTGRLGGRETYQKLAGLGLDPYREFDDVVARHGGMDWALHTQLVLGTLPMKSLPDSDDRRGWFTRWRDERRWQRLRHSAVPRPATA